MSEASVSTQHDIYVLNQTFNALLQTVTNLTAQVTVLEKTNNETILITTSHQFKISCAIFVLLMQVGFSLLEAGTVRFKNTRNIMIKNVLDTCVCGVAFWLFGYTIGFMKGNGVFGWAYKDGVVGFAYDGRDDNVDWFFQFSFAATSTTIIAGAIAERTHLLAYLIYNFVSSSLIYPLVAHMMWSSFGFMSITSNGRNNIILGTNGVLDNAGSLVVHVTGGMTSLVGAWMVGPRIGRYDIDGNPIPFKPHSMVFTAAGTIILWVGFYGFNGGSVGFFGQDSEIWVEEVAFVCLNTTLCCMFSGLTVFLLTIIDEDQSLEDTFNGVIGGLVAACATSSVVKPYAAFIIGVGAGLSYLYGKYLINYFQIDDVVMAVPTHLFCGSWGAIAAGFFANRENIRRAYKISQPKGWGVLHGGGFHQLGVQLLALLIVYVWVGFSSWVVFYFLDLFGALRVKRKIEEIGLDVVFHGGEEDQEDDSQLVGSRPLKFFIKRENLSLFLNPSNWKKLFQDNERKSSAWNNMLHSTPFGQISLAMYEGNYIMEDTSEIELSTSGVYIGVHDGHGGSEVSEFLRDNLYINLKDKFMRNNGNISKEMIKAAFLQTEEHFTEVVRQEFLKSPHLATVGSCSVIAIITNEDVWVANVGDCRAVLGQVKKMDGGKFSRARALSVDHNLNNPHIREQFIMDHIDMHDAVVEKQGICRVKGKVTVTKSFGDLYLKAHEFNREPLYARFRVPPPFNPPLLSVDPYIFKHNLEPHDEFLIVASDGLFEFVSNQEAVDIVLTSPRKIVAKTLIKTALKRAAEKHEISLHDLIRLPAGQRREYHDDMTVVVFFFDKSKSKGVIPNNQWQQEASMRGGVEAILKLNSPERSNGLNSV